MSEGYDLRDALMSIDPTTLGGYDDWLNLAMGMHAEGYDYDVCREWLGKWGASYDDRTFRQKWKSFGHSGGPQVTGGTIVKMAMDRGWKPESKPRGHALSWDSVIGPASAKHIETPVEQERPVVDADTLSDDEVEVTPLFEEGGIEELVTYIEALFEPTEYVGYVLRYENEYDEDGNIKKRRPGDRGSYTRTAKELCDSLRKGSIENALGTIHEEAGAWIRFNPLDGNGVGNANVTDFRYALLESDETPNGKFAAIVKHMNLPVAAMVDSGKRSLHAIVRIDAKDKDEYTHRVVKLYERAEKNGIEVDRQNKNASRLSRMPGVMREGRRQFLAGLSQGASDWDEWEEWYAEATDELPDAVPLDTMLGENLPPLKPALIDGVLRIGHKMLLSGPSKAGKSFLLMNLCVCLAEGWRWLGFECRRSRVMYVNLELDDASCFNRFSDMYAAMERRGMRGTNQRDIDVWNLRGLAQPMHKLLPKLVRRVKKRNIDVVVVDPIYKVQSGDENSAGEMAQFSNLFDALAREGSCSVIYCHHHSKGFQGGKRSIDRASGSGVFGRDPDAIVDMIELEVDEADRWKHVQDAICAECAATMEANGFGQAWGDLDERTRNIESNAVSAATEMLVNDGTERALLRSRCDAIRARKDSATAWRLEGTLREFPSFSPIGMWFDWPLHTLDENLKDAVEAGAEEPPKRKSEPRRKNGDGKPKMGIHGNEPIEDSSEIYDEINGAIAKAIEVCAEDGVEPTRNNIHKRIDDIQGKKPEYRQICRWTDAGKTWVRWIPGGPAKDSKRNEKVIVKRE